MPTPAPKCDWKVLRVSGPNTLNHRMVVEDSYDMEYALECYPEETVLDVRGTMKNITRFRAEKIVGCFATDYGKDK